MRILTILYGFGLQESELTGPLSEMLSEIAKKGNELYVICPKVRGESERQTLEYESGRIEVFRISKPSSTFLKIFFFFYWVYYSVKIGRRYRTDLIYTHILGTYGLIGLIASKILKVPQVHWICQFMAPYTGKYHYKYRKKVKISLFWRMKSEYAIKLALQNSKKIIVCTQAVKQEIMNFFSLPEEKFTIIPNSVSLERFEQKKDEEESSAKEEYDLKDKKIILSVNWLSESKGPQYLVRAIPLLKKEVEDFSCMIVGAGHQQEFLKKLSKDLKVEDKVIFTGPIPHRDLPIYYALCDVFVLPSTFEGFGRVLLEAMASKKPIVASNVGGIPEVAPDGEVAILVPPKNPNILAEAILKILTDKKFAEELADRGYSRAKSRYTTEVVAEKYINIFNEVVK